MSGNAQGDRQASIRATTGTTNDIDGDWMALFDLASIPQGDYNGRLLAWINQNLTASYTDLNGAMQALALANGACNFSSMGTFDTGSGPPPVSTLVELEDSSGTIELEDGSGSIQLES